MATRPYNQTRRAESTAATRRRILEAARRQLVSGQPFTIEQVAREAAVSRVTVYTQFMSGDQLREAVFDDLARSGGLTSIPSAFTTADPIDGIARLVQIFCGFYARHRIVLRRLNALAALAASAGDRPAGRNRRRRHMFAVLLKRLAEVPGHRSLDVDALSGTLQALTSFELYDQLAASRNQTAPADVIDHLVRMLLESST